MKTIYKILAMLVALPIVAAFASCSKNNDEPEPAEKDYSVAIQYTGMFTSSDNALMAVTNVTLGADVASARIGWCQGNASTAGLAFVTEKGQLITKGGEWKLEFPKDAMSGTYTVYAVSFDEKGNAKESAYEEFQYDAPKESWTPKYYGTWEFSLRAFRIDEGIPYYRSNLVLSVCDQDGSKYKISNLWDGVDFFFTLKDNKVSFEDQYTGTDFGYGKLLISDLGKYPGYETYEGYLSGDKIHFGVYYVDDEWSWGYGYETFTLDKAYK